MKITIEINGDNAAFNDNPGEFARILHKIAAEIADYPHKATGPVRDVNGNRCGYVTVED